VTAPGFSRRALLRGGVGAAAAAALRPRRAAAQEAPPPAGAASASLNLLTWEGYAPPALVERFERETSIKVTVATYESNRELLTKLKASKSAHDLVQPTVTLVPAGAREGYYRPFELDRLRHAGNLLPGMLRACEEFGGVLRGERYALPFAWGAEGLSYDSSRLATRPDSFGVLHDPAHAGLVSYRATVHVFLATGLWLGLGRRMRDVYVSEDDARPILDAVLERLIEGKKLVRTYWTTAGEIEQLLEEGDVAVAQTWDATGWKLERRGKPIRFVAPREGALAWMDTFAIPKEARHVEPAYAWIDFMYDPRNAAAFTSETGYATAVAGAAARLEPGLRRQFEASFSPRDLDNLWWYGIQHSWWSRVVAEYVDRLQQA